MRKFLKNNWWKIVIFFVLIFIIFYLFKENIILKNKILYEYETVPDVELLNEMSFDSKGKASGKIRGFVAFLNIEDQPGNLKQYYEIEALDLYDENSKQLFIYDDIIKMSVLSPSSIGKTLLHVVKNDSDSLILVDQYNNSFTIFKQKGYVIGVSMQDTTGDMTYLINDDSRFRDFILYIKK